jgi:hypothetical protein
MTARILDLPASDYHADKLAERPSLSKSTIHTLLSASPKHAWTNHTRLNPAFSRTEEWKFQLGTAAHALYFEGDAGVQVCDYDSWRSGAAKEDRDLALAHGKIPMLPGQWDDCQAMVAAMRTQLAEVATSPLLFTEGTCEQTVTWQEGDVECRARPDYLRDDLTFCDDLKTTSASAHPDVWSRRTLFSIGADVQVVWYLRGIKAATGATPKFRFVIVETFAPFALSVITLSPAVLALAEEKVERALTIWRKCLANDSWPAYPTDVHRAELPAWIESQWLEREAREEIAA